jgi:hypothetical protein
MIQQGGADSVSGATPRYKKEGDIEIQRCGEGKSECEHSFAGS